MSLQVLTQGGGTGGASASIFVTGLSEADAVTATKDSKTVKGKWGTIPNPASVVPDGYTQLESIKGTGAQWIDLGFVPTTNTKIQIKFSMQAQTGDAIIGHQGGESSSNDNADWRMFYTGNWFYADVGSGRTYGGSPSLNTVYELELGNLYLKDLITGSNILTGTAQSSIGSSVTAKLFYGLTTIAQGTVYYIKHYEGDTLAEDWVPCINGGGSIGLCDIVSDTFYPNSGTGAFAAGAEIPSTINGHIVEPIKEYGTWTVTAANGENATTQDVLVDAAIEFTIPMSLSA